MDKLQNIDQLLKASADSFKPEGLDFAADWSVIENRLKRRKNRIYATWFSLALVALSVSGLWFYTTLDRDSHLVTNGTTIIQEDSQVPQESTIDMPDLFAPSLNEQAPVNTNDQRSYAEAAHAPIPGSDDVNMPIHSPSEPPALMTYLKSRTLEGIIVQADVELPGMISPLANRQIVHTDLNDPARETSAGHWEIGAGLTPALSHKWVSSNPSLAGLINESYFSIIDQSENANFAYQTGISVSYHWNNNWSLHTGLGISTRSEAVNYNYVIDKAPVLNVTESRIDSYILLAPSARIQVDHSGSNSYHFITIPVQLGYNYPLGSSWEIRSRIGLSYMQLTDMFGKSPDYTYLTLYDLGTSKIYNKSNLATIFGTGLYYNFKNFVIGAEPTFSSNISSLSVAESAINVKPYSYGFNLSAQIKLNKL